MKRVHGFRSTLLSFSVGPDIFDRHGLRIVIGLCCRRDLARFGERAPAALWVDFHIWLRGLQCRLESNARAILDRNLQVAEGRFNPRAP